MQNLGAVLKTDLSGNHELRQTLLGEPARPRSRTAFDTYITEYERSRPIPPKTLDDAVKMIARFGRMVDEPLETLTRVHVTRWIDRMRSEEKLAIPTIEKALWLLRTYWRWLTDHGYVKGDNNPFSRHRMVDNRDHATKQAAKRRGWSKADLARLLEHCHDRDLRRLILIAAYTGARRGSIVTLMTTSIVFIQGIRCLHFDDKTPSGRRDVPIHPEISGLIDEMIDEAEDGWLFNKAARGTNIDNPGDRLGKKFTYLKRKLKYGPNLVFHSLRHMLAEQTSEIGGDLNTIGDTLGHADTVITKLYTKRASVPKIHNLLTQLDLSDT